MNAFLKGFLQAFDMSGSLYRIKPEDLKYQRYSKLQTKSDAENIRSDFAKIIRMPDSD